MSFNSELVNNIKQLKIRRKLNWTDFTRCAFQYVLSGKKKRPRVIIEMPAILSVAHSLIWSSMNPTTTFFPSAQREPVGSGRKMNSIFSSHNYTRARFNDPVLFRCINCTPLKTEITYNVASYRAEHNC